MHVIAMTVKVYIVMKYKRKRGIPAFIFGNRKWNDKMGKLWCFLFSVEIIDVWPASHQMPNALRGADTTSDPSLTGASVRSLRPGVSDLSAGKPGSDDIRSALQQTR